MRGEAGEGKRKEGKGGVASWRKQEKGGWVAGSKEREEKGGEDMKGKRKAKKETVREQRLGGGKQ